MARSSALSVLPIARRLAALAKAHLRILHVTEADQPLTETAAALGLEPAHLRGCTLEARAGDPAKAILAAAADCGSRLIVMGSHVANAQPAVAIGDMALAVLGAAPCPVVVVDPARTAAGWDLGAFWPCMMAARRSATPWRRRASSFARPAPSSWCCRWPTTPAPRRPAP